MNRREGTKTIRVHRDAFTPTTPESDALAGKIVLMKDVADEIIDLRRSIGLNQTEAGALVGVSLDTIRVYENAHRPIPRVYRMALRAIAEGVLDPVLFDVDPVIAEKVARAIAARKAILDQEDLDEGRS